MYKLKRNILLICLALLFMSCKNDLKCYILPSTENVDSYKNFASDTKISLVMAKAEYEHFQLVFETIPNEEYSICNQQENADLTFNFRKIESINGYDDVLVPTGKQILAQDTIVKLWVTCQSGYNTKPGTYKEQMVLIGKKSKQTIHINVTVYDVELPIKPSIPAAFGIIDKNLHDSTNLKSEEQENIRLKWADLCLNYRINPYFSTWLEKSMKHEAHSSPWKWNDVRTAKFLADERFNRYAIPYHSLQKQELKEMLQTYEEAGILKKAYFYLWDEPVLTSEYQQINDFAQEIHEISPQASVLTTFYCGPKDGKFKDQLFSVFDLWKGNTQIYCMSAWALKTDETKADTCRTLLQNDDEWWTYVCMGPDGKEPNLLLSMTGYQHRAVLWRSWKEKTTGFLYWAVNAFDDMKKLTYRKDLPAGDGVLIYPGELFNCKDPVVSIRLERWRDGIEDYEYLKLLEQKVSRAKAESIFNSIYQSPVEYTNNYTQINKFRETALDILKK